ncbi:sigma-70 family RNA polymerase sigma factor [Aquihabitans sp. G128]|uniref:RNA polymerase sigma factor n=1 Tax=Aquihabitans sp. G128 TaxID=2849779 RepID=UPI001C211902|nr:sigma-70 family RNA polymerase sigma factor [Aquihabitans sp. G128]QXC63269.1 sigma-70 family RNA polymerase sigma factor [Aquihabitans sp. G128]
MANTDEGRLVEAARRGDQRAFGQLFDQWYDRVHDLSRRIVHDDGIAGEVAQDAFLKAWTKLATLDDPDAFGGWLLRIARNGSLNRLAKERRAVTMDDETMSVVRDADAPDHDPLEAMDQAARISLVWDAAAALGERDASVLDLHLRHGLTPAELAEELGVTPNNAHQVLFTMRKRLGNAVRALVLWRAGHPTCPDLRQGLAAAGLTSFGAPMVKAIDRHVDGCAECSQDRSERISPAALFAAAPVVLAPVLLKAQAASALAEAGVPMAGSTAGAAGAGASGPSGTPGSSGTAGPTGDGNAAGSGGPNGLGGPNGPGGPVDLPPPGSGDAARSGSTARRRSLVGAAVVLVVLALLGIGAVWGGVDGDEVDTAARVADTATTSTLATTVPGQATTTTVGSLGTVPTGDTTAPPPTAPGQTTAPTPPTTVVPPPVVDRFDATPTAQRCRGSKTDYLWDLAWETTGADTATLRPTGGAAAPVDPDSSTTACAPSGTTFVLDATGTGGTTSATAGGTDVPTTTTSTTAPPPPTTAPPTTIVG